jgi:hypothetical protein
MAELPPRSIAVPLVLAIALTAGCGSTRPSRGNAAAISAALQLLQTEVEQGRRGVPHGSDVLGTITLVYAAPPKGVTPAEWRSAVNKDRTLQRLLAAK